MAEMLADGRTVEIVEAVVEQTKIRVLPTGLMDRENAALYLNRATKTLADWHTKNIGPKSKLVGGRRFYAKEELDAFMLG